MTGCTTPDAHPSAESRRAPHWHAGHNQPGCLPEADPGTFSSFEDAQEALADDMEFHARSEDAWAGEHPCRAKRARRTASPAGDGGRSRS
jgi:hypothetical protein